MEFLEVGFAGAEVGAQRRLPVVAVPSIAGRPHELRDSSRHSIIIAMARRSGGLERHPRPTNVPAMISVITTLLFWLCAGLFGLKLLWNLVLPYSLAFEPLTEGRGSRGTSLMPYVEAVLLLIGVALAALRGGTTVGMSVLRIGLIGMAAVVATYVHMAVAATIMGWLVRNRSRGRP